MKWNGVIVIGRREVFVGSDKYIHIQSLGGSATTASSDRRSVSVPDLFFCTVQLVHAGLFVGDLDDLDVFHVLGV